MKIALDALSVHDNGMGILLVNEKKRRGLRGTLDHFEFADTGQRDYGCGERFDGRAAFSGGGGTPNRGGVAHGCLAMPRFWEQDVWDYD